MKIYPTAQEALQGLKSDTKVFIQGAAATPLGLIDGLMDCEARFKSELSDIELVHIHTEGKARYADPAFHKTFKVRNLFVGANIRAQIDFESVDFVPCFLSEIPQLFRTRRIPLDMSLIQVSPPDAHGYCSLGTSVDVTRAAVESSKLVIAEINPRMPRVHGDGILHVDEIDAAIQVDRELPEQKRHQPTPLELKIGQNVASLVEDGATLQVGIGPVPDAALQALKNHRGLGVHTEMWSDGMLDLLKSGAVTNANKKVLAGKTVSGFVVGTRAVYDFVHDNPSVLQLGSDWVNDPGIIRTQPKMVAINSAIEVDLTGQVCADSVGSRIISGVGGQMDFIRGASLSQGGKPIIAMTSRSKNGTPRVVASLRTGAGVVTTRAHVHFVVTEYGIADLYGKSLGERARVMIQIAHPDDREDLDRQWFELKRQATGVGRH